MTTDWKSLEARYYMHVVNRQPLVVERGEGSRVWDTDGKEYLDFTAGWAVCNLGHNHPAVVRALQEQATRLWQMSNQFYTIPQLELARLLVDNSSLDRVFFANSGTEANEGAIKLARKYGRLQRNGAQEIITALNSFHGRTTAMIAATGQPPYQERWKPLAPGFVNVEYNSVAAVREATTTRTAAVMIEVVQGEGGVHVSADDYLKGLREWCDHNDLLLIFDEIQTGMGRLGTLWGYEAFSVEPDVMTLAKGLGNGIPVGAFLAKEHCAVLEPGDHGSTFGGNALATAAASATVQTMIAEDIPARSRPVAAHLRRKLEELKVRYPETIVEIRGVGLLLGIQFSDTIASRIVSACNREGLLTNAVRPDTLRLMPPLIITASDVDVAIQRLERGLVSAVGSG